MKLHLPHSLRTALVASFAAITPLTVSVSASSLATGFVLYSIAAHSAYAETLSNVTIDTSATYDDITISGEVTIQAGGSDNTIVSTDGTLTLESGSILTIEEWQALMAAAAANFTSSTITNDGTLSMGDLTLTDTSTITNNGTMTMGGITTSAASNGTLIDNNGDLTINGSIVTLSNSETDSFIITNSGTLTINATVLSDLNNYTYLINEDGGNMYIYTNGTNFRLRKEAYLINEGSGYIYAEKVQLYYNGYVQNLGSGTIEIDTVVNAGTRGAITNYSSGNITVGTLTFSYNADLINDVDSTGTITVDTLKFSNGTTSNLLNLGSGDIIVNTATLSTTPNIADETLATTEDNGVTINASDGRIIFNTLSLTYTHKMYNEGDGTMAMGSVTTTNGNYIYNTGGGDLYIGSGSFASGSAIVNSGAGTLYIGTAYSYTDSSSGEQVTLDLNESASITLVEGSLISNTGTGTLSLDGTIVLQAESVIHNDGSLLFGDDLVFDISSYLTGESISIQILTEDSLNKDLTSLDISNLTGVNSTLYDVVFTLTGELYLISLSVNTFSWTGTEDTIELYDGLSLSGQTFSNTDLLSYAGTGNISLKDFVDITILTVEEGAALSLYYYDADSSLSAETVVLGANSTLTLTDASMLSGMTLVYESDATQSSLSTSTIALCGSDQTYDISASENALSTYTGTVYVSTGNTLIIGTTADAASGSSSDIVYALEMEAGSTLIKSGSEIYRFSYSYTYPIYNGVDLIIEEGTFLVYGLTSMTEDNAQTFASITIKEDGILYWSNSCQMEGEDYDWFTFTDLLTFDGGTLQLQQPYRNSLSRVEVTEKGGLLTVTANKSNVTIDCFTMVDGVSETSFTFDCSSGTSANDISIGEILNFNGTINIEGTYTTTTKSFVYVEKITNEADEVTNFVGLLYSSSNGLDVSGTVNFEQVTVQANTSLTTLADSKVSLTGVLIVNDGASLVTEQNSTLEISGQLTLAGACSIVNNGSLIFDTENLLLDISGLAWASADGITFNYQLLSGEGDNNWADLTEENILDASAGYLYTFNADGSLSYTFSALTYTGASLNLYSGVGGFSSGDTFSNGDSI